MDALYLQVMNVAVLLFGITTELLSTNSLTIETLTDATVSDLKAELVAKYPQLENINSYAIAVNEAYASNDTILKENDVIAIIPPVSGG